MGQATATLILKIVLALQRKPPCASKLVNSSTPLSMHSQCPYSVQVEEIYRREQSFSICILVQLENVWMKQDGMRKYSLIWWSHIIQNYASDGKSSMHMKPSLF